VGLYIDLPSPSQRIPLDGRLSSKDDVLYSIPAVFRDYLAVTPVIARHKTPSLAAKGAAASGAGVFKWQALQLQTESPRQIVQCEASPPACSWMIFHK